MAEPNDTTTHDADRLAELAAAARRGDRAAAAELLRALQDTIFRFALSQLGDRDAAQEATQETAVRLLTAIKRYEGKSRVTTWALGVTLNVCREHRRKRRPDSNDDAVAAVESAEPSAVWRSELIEESGRVRTAVAKLAPRQREAIVLRYFEQLTVAETAEAMACPVGTAKATLFQALRRLRAAFEKKDVEKKDVEVTA